MFLLRRPFQLATRICHTSSAAFGRAFSGPPRPLSCLFSRLFLSLLCVVSVAAVQAQQYAASLISADLKTDADAVIRSSEYNIEIKSPSHAIIRERRVVTILNSHADDLAEYNTFYSKMNEINSVEGILYNADGEEIQHFKKKEMTDRPVWDGQTLATDYRYKTGSFTSHQYPYTVAFEEEDELSGIINLADWVPQTERNSAVEYSHYSITAPKGYTVRYKMLNSEVKPVISEVKDKISYSWELRNIKPVPEEAFSIPWTALQPHMLVAPSEFEASGYKGNMSTWNDFAKFFADLSRGRDILPEDIKAKVHLLTDGQADPHKKIAVLYDFLQKNTHYISIQLGIGGYQPFDASYVSRNKYGDCKALSNYMKSLLKEVGIPANVVIIRGGKNATDFQPDFPDNQFNHAICCVPLANDTVWLECTDQYLPAGYLSSFTANRYGLMVTENGGQLVHTPDYALPENKQVRSISAVMDADGNLKIRSDGIYRAERQDNLEARLHHLSRSEQETRLKQQFDLPTYDINAFDYQPGEDHGLPIMREMLDISVNSYSQVSGKRIFINPDLLTRSDILFPAGETRQRGLEFRDTYSTVDSVVISIPEGFTEESRPKDQVLKTAYGEYRSVIVISPGKITYYRMFQQFRGVFPVDAFSDASKFYNTVYKCDRERIVLVKKE